MTWWKARSPAVFPVNSAMARLRTLSVNLARAGKGQTLRRVASARALVRFAGAESHTKLKAPHHSKRTLLQL